MDDPKELSQELHNFSERLKEAREKIDDVSKRVKEHSEYINEISEKIDKSFNNIMHLNAGWYVEKAVFLFKTIFFSIVIPEEVLFAKYNSNDIYYKNGDIVKYDDDSTLPEIKKWFLKSKDIILEFFPNIEDYDRITESIHAYECTFPFKISDNYKKKENYEELFAFASEHSSLSFALSKANDIFSIARCMRNEQDLEKIYSDIFIDFSSPLFEIPHDTTHDHQK